MAPRSESDTDELVMSDSNQSECKSDSEIKTTEYSMNSSMCQKNLHFHITEYKWAESENDSVDSLHGSLSEKDKEEDEKGTYVGYLKAWLVHRDIPGESFYGNCDSINDEMVSICTTLTTDEGRLLYDKIEGLERGDASHSRGGFLVIEEIVVQTPCRGKDMSLDMMEKFLFDHLAGRWTMAVIVPGILPRDDNPPENEHGIDAVTKQGRHFARIGFRQVCTRLRNDGGARFWYLVPEHRLQERASKESTANLKVFREPHWDMEGRGKRPLAKAIKAASEPATEDDRATITRLAAAATAGRAHVSENNTSSTNINDEESPSPAASVSATESKTSARTSISSTINQEEGLHWAIAHEKLSVCFLLADLGGDVNHKNAFEQTPLHLAAKMCNSKKSLECCKALIHLKQARIESVDVYGDTPYQSALSKIWNSHTFDKTFDILRISKWQDEAVHEMEKLRLLMGNASSKHLIEGILTPRMLCRLTAAATISADTGSSALGNRGGVLRNRNTSAGRITIPNIMSISVAFTLVPLLSLVPMEELPGMIPKTYALGWQQQLKALSCVLQRGEAPTFTRVQTELVDGNGERGGRRNLYNRKYKKEYERLGGCLKHALNAVIRKAREMSSEEGDGTFESESYFRDRLPSLPQVPGLDDNYAFLWQLFVSYCVDN